MDGEEQRKIRFSVPPAAPPQLDPRQVELIRRRRPTPATLFRLTDHPSPEEDGSSQQVAVCENGGVKTRKDNPTPYQPPSLKAVQKMARSHLQSPDVSDSEDISPDSDRDPTDYDISNQSGQNSALEFTDEEEDGSAPHHQTAGAEEDGSTPLHQTAGAAVQAYMKCPEKGAVPWETSENEKDAPGSAEELPDITTANQSDHHSDHEVIDEQLGSAPLHEALTE